MVNHTLIGIYCHLWFWVVIESCEVSFNQTQSTYKCRPRLLSQRKADAFNMFWIPPRWVLAHSVLTLQNSPAQEFGCKGTTNFWYMQIFFTSLASLAGLMSRLASWNSILLLFGAKNNKQCQVAPFAHRSLIVRLSFAYRKVTKW